MPSADPPSSASRFDRLSGAGCLRLFCLPFFLGGAAFLFGVTIGPVLQMLDARHWPTTACVVDSSQVISHQGDDSATYSVEVVYRYAWADKPYTSRRYSFVTGSWAGPRARQATVDRYPSGTETVCYVNPANPREAVLDRGWQPEMGMGALGLVFALASGLGLVFARQIAPARRQVDAAHSSGAGDLTAHASEYTPFGQFLRILIGALIWNGFIGFIAYFLFFVEDRERVELGPRIIIGLFLVAGVFLLIKAGTHFLGLFWPSLRPATAPFAKAKKRHR